MKLCLLVGMVSDETFMASDYYRDYVVWGKTGYTSAAKNTLVTYSEQDGVKLEVGRCRRLSWVPATEGTLRPRPLGSHGNGRVCLTASISK